jgi:feruloyl esterase
MRRLALLVLFCLALRLPAVAANCEGLAGLPLPHGKITLAVAVPAGDLAGLTPRPLANLPAFCRVAATLMPSIDSDIRIEVWMPVDGWSGKYEGTGNGGYAGSIAYGGLASGLRRGYAVANTDLGTYPTASDNSSVLIGHPEKWLDWGSRGTHEMTVAAKRIVQAYYGRNPQFSYYVGCSTGGQQGLVEAERFPDDFDGVIAGAPANNRTRLHMEFIWDQAASAETPGSYIPASKLPLIARAALTACGPEKAVATDAFLTHPAECKWDPQTLLCTAGDAPACLTAAQVATAKKIYDGPRNPITHASIYPGLTRGSELDWDSMMPQGAEPRYDALFKWTFGANWDWRTFDFNRDVAKVDALLAGMVNATDPDLETFKAHGHKLIVYHGWADVIVPSLESINYYNSVENAQAQEAALHHQSAAAETQMFYRLFMVPGMGHCGGGPGLNGIDPVDALEQWVEKGTAPERIIAKRTVKSVTQISRPVCPYPQSARYNGSGDTGDAANFTCVNPASGDGK